MNIGKFCAHRGVPVLEPENTIPSFAVALELGADEIEFDVRIAEDGKLIVSHDSVWGPNCCTPEEIFEKFANKIDFNIHVKRIGEDGFVVRELANLIEKYNAYEHAYFAGSYNELECMIQAAPQIRRVAIQWIEDEESILEKAKRYQCWGVQLWRGMFDEETIRELHKENIRCNYCFVDDEEGFKKYFDMGIDVLLTNRMDLAAKYKKEGEFQK